MSWHKLNFRNNGPVLLFTALFTKMRTLNSVAINDKDGHGLKVDKLGPTFSIFNLMTAEMSLWFVLPADEIGLIHVSSS